MISTVVILLTLCIEGENVRIVNHIPPEDLINRGRTHIPTDLRKGNTIVATLDRNHCIQLGGQKEEENGPTKLSIGVLKPKLERKGRSSSEATIQSVLADLLGDDSRELAEGCEECFTAKSKVNLTMFRIKVNFYTQTDCHHLSWVSQPLLLREPAGESISQDILDTGEWALDLFYVSPRVSCLGGGHEITLVSEYDLKKDVVPVFQVYDEQDEPCELSGRLNQPKIKNGLSSNDHGLYIGKKTSFIMLCPGQARELLTELSARKLKLKLLIKRGKYVSQKKFEFQYLEMSGEHCPYHHQHNHRLPTIESAKPFSSKRKVEMGKEEKKTREKKNKTETETNDLENISLPPMSEMMEVHQPLR